MTGGNPGFRFYFRNNTSAQDLSYLASNIDIIDIMGALCHSYTEFNINLNENVNVLPRFCSINPQSENLQIKFINSYNEI